MSQIIELFTQSSLYLLLVLLGGFFAKSHIILNWIKDIRSLFFNRKTLTIDSDSSYFVRSINGRFGFSFLEYKIWDKVIPYNGDGCSFIDRVDSLIQYSISAGFDPGYEYDMLDQKINEEINRLQKFTRKFKLLQSRRMSVKTIDISENKIIPMGAQNAYRIVYNFREKNNRMVATEIIAIFRGARFGFYFQAPRKKYKACIPLINHLLSEYYILHDDSEMYVERKVSQTK